MSDFIDALTWREMIHSHIPGLAEYLEKEGGNAVAYIGFDPTAPSLHIGNLAVIMLLKHFQLAGHKPVVLVGGATGMIGDPSGKSAERNLLNEKQLLHNQESIKIQLSKFLDFEEGPCKAEILNNYDWHKDFSLIEFLRDVGKHITVNYMMAKDSVKNRINRAQDQDEKKELVDKAVDNFKNEGLSFTEFSYQLLQGYDFYHLYKSKGIKLQMGGSDQWGNITTGTELIRRKLGEQAFALTTPLVTKADGTKFGKTEEGNIWLSPKRTNFYKFYQFWLNCSDTDAPRLIRVFTLLDKEEILRLEEEHTKTPHLRILQKAIAKDVTIRVHSENAYDMAVEASEALFSKSEEKLMSLNEEVLQAIFDTIPSIVIDRSNCNASVNIVDLLTEKTHGMIFSSKGEARRMISGGGVSINKQKVADVEQKADFKLLHDRFFLVRKGKKNDYIVKVDP